MCLIVAARREAPPELRDDLWTTRRRFSRAVIAKDSGTMAT